MNKVILVGRLTKDPDLRFAAGSGTAIARLTLAVNRPMKKDEADFINCIAFGKTGETIVKYFTKGKQIAFTGNIRTGSYDAKDGTKRYTTDVIIETFEFVADGTGGAKDNANQSNSSNYDNANNSFDSSATDDMMPIDDSDIPF